MRPFFEALILGFSIAAPVGPIGLLCIRRTLLEGRATGFASGLGAATADAIYGLIAALGITAVTVALGTHQSALRYIGAAYLLWLGARTWRAPMARESITARGGLAKAWASTFLLTITNPATIASFAAMFSAIVTTSQPDAANAALLVSGVFLGSACWWLILSFSVDRLRDRFSPEHLRFVNRAAGALLVAFAAWAAFFGG
jgi:threonine/homoserine/homoserine lactone efflux protein